MKNILLISHISETYAPTFPFEKFLNKKTEKLDVIFHPLVNTSIRQSIYKVYGKIKKKKKYNRPIKTSDYIYHGYLNLKWIFFNKKKYDLVFGLNNICALSGLILKWFGKAKKVIYYTVDYSDNRFKNKFLNSIYYFLDNFCVKHCDYTMSVSPRIIKVREKKGLQKKRNLLQPNGVHTKDIISRKKTYEKIKFFSATHITDSKGLDMIVGAVSKLDREKKKNITVDIVGEGPYKKELKKIIKDHDLDKIIKLKGQMTNDEILKILSSYHVGIALYNMRDQFNYYCDPVKVKEYIAGKLLTLVSDVPYIANIVEEKNIGYKVKYDTQSVYKAIKKLSDKKNVKRMIDNFSKIDFELDWDKLFEKNYKIISKQ